MLGDAEGKYRSVWVRCSCEAATEKVIVLSALTAGGVTSCGCWNRESAAQRPRARAMPIEMRKPPKPYVKRDPRFRVTDEGRECSACRVDKPWSEYNKGNGVRLFCSRCRDCQKLHSLEKSLERASLTTAGHVKI